MASHAESPVVAAAFLMIGRTISHYRVVEKLGTGGMGRVINAGSIAEIGISAKRLVVPITETSGSVWLLDNIRQ